MKKIIALLLAGAMAVSMAACGKGSTTSSAASGTASAAESSAASTPAATDLASQSKYPGTPDKDMITVNMVSEPPEMNSMLTTDTGSSAIQREVLAGLTKLDKNDNPIPDIAESWTVSNENKTYTFKLRKDAKWSNGEPVTAKDFVFAWTTIMTKATASEYSFILCDNIKGGQDFYDGKIKADGLGIKAADDYTLEVTFEHPIPYALQLFSFQTYLPVNQKAYESIGAANYGKDADKIATNGAYKIASWTHNESITLEKNPDYWDAANVGIPKIKFMMLADANATLNAFKAGQLDFMTVGSTTMPQFQAEGQPLANYTSGGVWYVQYNTKDKAFANAKIRQAFGMAIDRESLVKNVLKDGSQVATGITPSGIAGANGKYAEARGDITLKFDPTKAKQLLDEGLKEVGMTKDQLKVAFLTGNTTAAVRDSTFMQEQWKTNLGVSVELKPMVFKARLAAMTSGDFQMVYAGWSPDYNDPLTFLDLWTTTNGNNHGKYSSATYDKYITDAINAADPAKRQEILITAEKLAVQQDAPLTPLYFDVINYTTSQKFTGGTYTGFQGWPGDYTDGAKLTK